MLLWKIKNIFSLEQAEFNEISMTIRNLKIPVDRLAAIGDFRRKALEAEKIVTVEDLLYYFPRRYLDRSSISPINRLVVGQQANVVATVERIELKQAKKRKILHILLNDGGGFLTLSWFRGTDWVKKVFHEGDLVSVSGKVEFYHGVTMSHPEFDFLDKGQDPVNTSAIVPVYPMTAGLRRSGLSTRVLRKIMVSVLEQLDPGVEDCLPQSIRDELKLPSLLSAIGEMHFPSAEKSLERAKKRFKFQELYMMQLLIALRQNKIKSEKTTAKCGAAGNSVVALYKQTPFEPTAAQKRVINEIFQDMKSDRPMNRLLQGDVGSGKTWVASMAAAIMADNGFQTAIMAPTEILARQHAIHFEREFNQLRIPCCLLTGKTSKKERETMLPALADGRIPIVIGTHALIQEAVAFKDLGLVIIDEQHRFGVDQRGDLIRKGHHPHVLAMTATPIPRTLSMTLYGDMDVSVIDELPPGRKAISTKMISPGRLPGVYDFLQKEMDAGRQVYVVYPLIKESEKMDLKAAEEGLKELKTYFPAKQIALLHGKTANDEKNRIMGAFKANEIQLLVSTTVIEVGINVPNASVMLIENAERFGLSQLHQLRGRVGRGADKSWCILVQRKETETSRLRLGIMEKTQDGFEISEADMSFRGSGDLFGSRQHGLPTLQIAELPGDERILEFARKYAFKTITADAHLLKPENMALKDYFLRKYQEKLDYVRIG